MTERYGGDESAQDRARQRLRELEEQRRGESSGFGEESSGFGEESSGFGEESSEKRALGSEKPLSRVRLLRGLPNMRSRVRRKLPRLRNRAVKKRKVRSPPRKNGLPGSCRA